MENIKSVTKYYLKNFWAILLFGIIPSVYIGLLLNPFKSIELLWNYSSLSLNSFGDFFNHLFQFSWTSVLLWFLGLIIVAVCISILYAKIEAHFRVGKFNFKLNFEALNQNFLNVLFSFVLISIGYFILNIINLCLMLLVHYVFFTHLNVLALSWILIIFLTLINLFAMFWLFVLLAITCVDSIIMGSPLNAAIGDAVHVLNKNIKENTFLILIFLTISLMFTLIGCAINLVLLTNSLIILFIMPFICIYAMTLVFKSNDISRYDNRQYYDIR